MILEAFSLRAPQLFPDEGSFITLQNIKASRQLRYQHCTHVEVTPAILSWINLAQDKFRSNCSLDEKRKRFSKKVARSALRLFIDRSSILLPFLIVRLEKNRKQKYIYIRNTNSCEFGNLSIFLSLIYRFI